MTKTLSFSGNKLVRDSSGNLVFSSGIEACLQNCATAMKAIQGEMIYNQTGGVPYKTVVWDNYRPRLFEAAARIVLKNVKDVVSVVSFSQSVDDGVLRYSATIKTIYGIGTI